MNESKQTPKERAAAFVGGLRRIRRDRGKLAALRRGLTDNQQMHIDAWPVIADLGGDIAQPVFLTVAALFATHPEESNDFNFGETCRRIALGDSQEIQDSFQRRFRRLLSSGDLVDITSHLRSWIRFAVAKSVGVNYQGLMFDLMLWNQYRDDIRVKWAKSFWQSRDTATEPKTLNATLP